jgi:uncharacterized protein (DUF2252 family)
MLESPFAFYRGAAAIMAADLAGSPTSGFEVQLCGDAHLANFGGYASPERQLVFDINDFDETMAGPWEWDVKRLAVSFEILGRQLGMPMDQRRSLSMAVAQRYAAAMAQFAGMPALQVWRAQLSVAELVAQVEATASGRRRRLLAANITKTRSRTSLQAFDKLTERTDRGPRIRNQPPVLERIETLGGGQYSQQDVLDRVASVMDPYRRRLSPDHRRLLEEYSVVDAARKVVGVGSVGTRAWVLLLVGQLHGNPLLLQVKEAQDSVLGPALGVPPAPDNGERVVVGQRLMQTYSDPFLGWTRAEGLDGIARDYYVRQLRDWKGSALVDTFDHNDAIGYAGFCAWALAKGHARSGDRVAIASYLGSGRSFGAAIGEFAAQYADQNERDHAALQAAAVQGRIEVSPDLG